MEEITRPTIVTDWHTHILPGLDDGSRDPEESVVMLQSLAAQGVSAAVLTPHFYPQAESPRRFLQRRKAAQAILEEAIGRQPGKGLELPSRIPGAEVYYFDELWSLEEEHMSALCIGGSRILMIEMPGESWDHRVFDCLEKLIYRRSIRPLIAHIDRYYKAPGGEAALDALIGQGLLVQLNEGALSGMLAARKALRRMQAGRIHRIGSDCHNMQDRKPELRKAMDTVEKNFGREAAAKYFSDVEDKIEG